MIAESESVDVSEGAVQALLDFSEGDMRKSITFLQVGLLYLVRCATDAAESQ